MDAELLCSCGDVGPSGELPASLPLLLLLQSARPSQEWPVPTSGVRLATSGWPAAADLQTPRRQCLALGLFSRLS